MLVATIGLCSVLIAIGMLVVFLRWISQPQTVAKNDPAQNNVVANKLAGDKPRETFDGKASGSAVHPDLLTENAVGPTEPSAVCAGAASRLRHLNHQSARDRALTATNHTATHNTGPAIGANSGNTAGYATDQRQYGQVFHWRVDRAQFG